MKITNYEIPLNLHLLCAVMTDLHDEVNSRMMKSLAEHRPDCILLVGDIVDRPSLCLRDATVDFLKYCARLCPTYYSFGNHERALLDDEVEIIKATGVHILDNDWMDCGAYLIGGLSTDARSVLNDRIRSEFRTNVRLRRRMLSLSAKKEHRRGDKSTSMVHRGEVPETTWLGDFTKQEKPKILLCHHPEYYEKYLANREIDLIVSGHAHGGQIRLFGHGLYASGQGFFPKYTSGVYDGKLVVSRGLSNTIKWIPRFFNAKELVYLHL